MSLVVTCWEMQETSCSVMCITVCAHENLPSPKAVAQVVPHITLGTSWNLPVHSRRAVALYKSLWPAALPDLLIKNPPLEASPFLGPGLWSTLWEPSSVSQYSSVFIGKGDKASC